MGHAKRAQALIEALDLTRPWRIRTIAARFLDGEVNSEQPFERARTLLVRGTRERRNRQWRAAREALGRALQIFEDLGAPLWAGKARAELARVGGRAPADGALTRPSSVSPS